MSRIAVIALLLAVACDGPPAGGPGDIDLGADAAPDNPDPPPDAAPPDPVDFFGPSLVFDEIRMADFTEEQHAFQLLGFAINPGLETAIADGTFLMGMSLVDLDDPSGQSDGQLSVATFGLVDSDQDPDDNFDPADPEQFTIAEGGTLGDIPTIDFTEATIDDGKMFASRVGIVVLLEVIFPIADAEFEGTLIASDDGEYITELVDGRIRGAISGGPLALVPNPVGDACPGGTMLDMIATGCGFLPLLLQPDTDIDGDGLEKYYDTDGDGAIDQCVDGDGTIIEGTDCTTDFRMADGYSFVWVLHGVRAHIDQTVVVPPDGI